MFAFVAVSVIFTEVGERLDFVTPNIFYKNLGYQIISTNFDVETSKFF